MAKQLNVALDFTANTTQAKQQIQELQQLLTKVAYSTDLGIDPSQMKEASAAAKELAVHLNEAYNQKTGNYDLSKLNASLAKSKTSVTELSTSLLKAGTTGQQAFIKLAQSIAAADQPMITLNARLQDFLTTFKNSFPFLLVAFSVTLLPFSSTLALEIFLSTISKLSFSLIAKEIMLSTKLLTSFALA